MVYDSDYREVEVTALETATPMTEQGADSPGAFVVPTTARRITEIKITAVPVCADDTAFGFSSAVHIHGSAVVLGEGWFPGPTGSVEGAATMSGSIPDVEPQHYLTNIPVKPGGQFTIDAFMLGEDIGSLHMMVQIVYDGPVVGKIIDMDYRSIDLTAANTLTTLTERGAAVVEGDFKPAYKVIGEIFVGAGAKITGAAAAVSLFAFHLSGPGLKVAGNYKFIGRGVGLRSDAVSANCVKALVRNIVNIETKSPNPIRVQAQMIEDDLGTAYSIVGFAYY